MLNFKCCSACLVTDVKMFCLSTKPTSKSTCTLGEIFTGFLGIPTFKNYNYVCFECARLVCKFQEFKSRCQKAQFILSTLVEDDPDIIKNVQCKHLTLSSKLTFTSMIMITININNENMKLINEVNTNKITNIDRINTKMHSIHESEKIIQTIDEVQNFEPKMKANKNDATMVKNKMHTEGNQNTLNEDTVEFTKDNNSDDDCEIIEEYLESEEDSFFSESPNENNKYLYAIVPTNENTKGSETVKTKRQFDILNAKFFEGFASVVDLTPEEAKKEVLLRKESSTYKYCSHKCDLCYRAFESQAAFENHKKKHTDMYGVYECDLCHLRYNAKRFVSAHINKFHKRKFICKLCPYACFSSAQAKNHTKFHKGKKYVCDACDKEFSMPNSLLQHKRYKHPTECVCEFCGDEFATPTGLVFHKKMIHKLVNILILK